MIFGRPLESSTSSLQRIAVTLVLLGLGGCGGTGGSDFTKPASEVANNPMAACDPSDSTTMTECGTLLVGITDAEGELVSYSVDILSVALERADGSTVETLSESTRIDLAELTHLSELVSAATLVPGEFIGGSVTIDYTNAEVFVESGREIVSATVVDRDGVPLQVVALSIELADNDHLFLRRGQIAFLSIDVDLAISHEVDTGTQPPTVVAEPLIVAEITPVVEKSIRVRGSLLDVDLEDSSYQIDLLPWHHRKGSRGPVTVHTTSATSFEIGEGLYVGTSGLEVFSELEAGTPIVAFATLNLNDRTLTASIVHGRDSVGGISIDAVEGNVVSRTGNELRVMGALVLHRADRPRFRRTVIVTVGPDTKVFRIADRDSLLTADALSVGQRIVAFGQFSDPSVTDEASTDPLPALDATKGRVRMNVTHLHGTVTGIVAGQVNLNLRGIDRLGIDMFDFRGSGSNAETDADAMDYEVSTGALAIDALEIDRAVRVSGFVSPFGEAPPDFRGHIFVPPEDLRSLVGIGWAGTGTSVPFSSIAHDGIVLDVTNPGIGERHHGLFDGELIDLDELPAAPTIVPRDGRALFAIYEPGHVELFSGFDNFVDELMLRLNNSELVKSFVAGGAYDEATNTLTAYNVVVLTNPGQ